MAKPYSQDLRDRVIDAVRTGKMSRRAAAHHTQCANPWPSRSLINGLNARGRENLSDMVAIAPPS